MKQLIVDLKTGDVVAEEIPAPALQENHVLIRNTRSVVSLGTEKMLVDFGKSGIIGKARQHRDRVQDVLAKIKTDGLKPTLLAVSRKLAKPIPLGYSSCGVVIGIGNNVSGFRIGDRVCSNGGHAEYVSVPQNLVANIPDGIDDDSAAFTVISAVALQGIRLIAPSFGETIVVIGLGLTGQLAVQLLKAAGCTVIGIDPSEQKRSIAAAFCAYTLAPAADIARQVIELTKNNGADAVLITAASKSDDLIASAAKMCRKRASVVLTGVVGLNLRRADFYEKEISFQVSASYGPGRYDGNYEEGRNDYPIGFVRWTAQRNFEAVLAAMNAKQLQPILLITTRKAIQEAPSFYSETGNPETLACLIEYPQAISFPSQSVNHPHKKNDGLAGNIGIIGAGNFTEGMLLPILTKAGAQINAIAGSTGLNASRLAKKYGIATATTDYKSIIDDNANDAVIITTRHHLHAQMVIDALSGGKHVFVEKPLALTHEELRKVHATYDNSAGSLTLGFNRRYAPLALKMRALMGLYNGHKSIIITCNAGYLAPESWIHDVRVGGGRLKSEACHFIDLACFFAASKGTSVVAAAAGDGAQITLEFEDGSTGIINYVTGGNKGYDKERVEIHCAGKSLIMENWRRLTGYGFAGFSTARSSQDKGHSGLLKAWLHLLKNGGEAPIAFDEIMQSSALTLYAADSIASGMKIAM